jgi:predicted alpha/beta hydrolase family esterase
MSTVLIVPGLRGHVPEHWQTLLAAELSDAQIAVRTVPPLEVDALSCAARVAAIEAALARIAGPVVLVAHSAGVLMVAHWAARHAGADCRIAGALLVTPPDLDAPWPSNYPSPAVLRSQGWAPLPQGPLPFPSILCASDNDYLAAPEVVQRMGAGWGSELLALGMAGHMNPASGYGHWPLALPLVMSLS